MDAEYGLSRLGRWQGEVEAMVRSAKEMMMKRDDVSKRGGLRFA